MCVGGWARDSSVVWPSVPHRLIALGVAEPTGFGGRLPQPPAWGSVSHDRFVLRCSALLCPPLVVLDVRHWLDFDFDLARNEPVEDGLGLVER